jgi:uncharacterized protein
VVVKSSKVILIGGIALFAGLEMGNFLPFHLMDLGIFGAIALGGSLWLFRRKSPLSLSPLPQSNLTQEDLADEIAKSQSLFDILAKEATTEDLESLKQELNNLGNLSLDLLSEFKINIMGEKYTGKSSLKNLLSVNLNENILFTENIDLDLTENIDITQDWDLVLFLITGDLTDSQWQIIQNLKRLHHRVLILLNKEDRYLPEERFLIIQEIEKKVKDVIAQKDIISITAAPHQIKVKQYQKTGEIKEWMENQEPKINNLLENLNHILTKEKEDLILRKSWRNILLFQQKIKTKLNHIRKEQSLPIIEKYQWIVATAIFANPIPSVDLLATAAINGQLLVDLSAVYQQKFSLDQAQNTAIIIGKLMVQLGLVELSTQIISNILKTNTVTYLAGSTIQGVSAAYLTRLSGLTLIEYYQEQNPLNPEEKTLNLEKLTAKLKQVFQQNQRGDFLKTFVGQILKSA